MAFPAIQKPPDNGLAGSNAFGYILADLGKKVCDRHADACVCQMGEQATQRLVHVHDDPVAVGGQDAVGARIQNIGQVDVIAG
jgi:hypothetical protein